MENHPRLTCFIKGLLQKESLLHQFRRSEDLKNSSLLDPHLTQDLSLSLSFRWLRLLFLLSLCCYLGHLFVHPVSISVLLFFCPSFAFLFLCHKLSLSAGLLVDKLLHVRFCKWGKFLTFLSITTWIKKDALLNGQYNIQILSNLIKILDHLKVL